jgi:hypothetical protein
MATIRAKSSHIVADGEMLLIWLRCQRPPGMTSRCGQRASPVFRQGVQQFRAKAATEWLQRLPDRMLRMVEGLPQPPRHRIGARQQLQPPGTTGLYPYAPADLAGKVFNARQFPKSSGYPEDAATGIAAAALAFGLLENGLVAAGEQPIRVRQGQAMGRPSEITVRFRIDAGQVRGCWVGGPVCLEASAEIALAG